jgi:hypothetical protein
MLWVLYLYEHGSTARRDYDMLANVCTVIRSSCRGTVSPDLHVVLSITVKQE